MRPSMNRLSAALLAALLSAAPMSAVPRQAGANADLFRAIEDGNPAAVENLVKAGADVNAAREDGGRTIFSKSLEACRS